VTSICLYFEVHQPMRLNRFSVFNIGQSTNLYDDYFDHTLNKKIFEKVAQKSYIPTNNLLLSLINRFNGDFKVSFSITGTFIEHCEKYKPELIDSFRQLLHTGAVDFIDETYFHSLSSMYDNLEEFEEQITMHRAMMKDLFDYEPLVFRNTEAIYDNRIAKKIEDMGYQGIITEGSDYILGWRSPNYLYRPINADLHVLLRNYKLSDDIGFRFSSQQWKEYPLTAEKYAHWLSQSSGDIINLFIDYETFGEHHWKETGIFDFLSHLPEETLQRPGLDFVTVNEAVNQYQPVSEIDVPWAISWADEERNVTTWLGNDMQKSCFYELQHIGYLLKKQQDPNLWYIWRLLQTSDHLYYMSTKGLESGAVHAYFSPYQQPYQGFINYNNILQDLRNKIESKIVVH
jgi:alpha-amylase